MSKEINRWYSKMWIGKGARFNAYRRLKKVYNFSNIAIIMFSVYIIALNLLVFIEGFDTPYLSRVITVINICLSVLVLGVSIYLNGRDYKVEYLSHHECGKKISTVYNKIASLKDNEQLEVNITDLIEEYQNIINENPYNHSPIDFMKMELSSEENNYNWLQKTFILFNYHISPILIYTVFIIVPPIVFYIIIG